MIKEILYTAFPNGFNLQSFNLEMTKFCVKWNFIKPQAESVKICFARDLIAEEEIELNTLIAAHSGQDCEIRMHLCADINGGWSFLIEPNSCKLQMKINDEWVTKQTWTNED